MLVLILKKNTFVSPRADCYSLNRINNLKYWICGPRVPVFKISVNPKFEQINYWR